MSCWYDCAMVLIVKCGTTKINQSYFGIFYHFVRTLLCATPIWIIIFTIDKWRVKYYSLPFFDYIVYHIQIWQKVYFLASDQYVSIYCDVKIWQHNIVGKIYDAPDQLCMVDSYFLSVKINHIIILIQYLVYALLKKLTKKSKTLSPSNSNPMHTCPPNSKLSIIRTQRLKTEFKTLFKQWGFNGHRFKNHTFYFLDPLHLVFLRH